MYRSTHALHIHGEGNKQSFIHNYYDHLAIVFNHAVYVGLYQGSFVITPQAKYICVT